MDTKNRRLEPAGLRVVTLLGGCAAGAEHPPKNEEGDASPDDLRDRLLRR